MSKQLAQSLLPNGIVARPGIEPGSPSSNPSAPLTTFEPHMQNECGLVYTLLATTDEALMHAAASTGGRPCNADT